MLQKSILQIKPDVFIFSCDQAFQARMRPLNRFDSHFRYEPFLFGTYSTTEKHTFEDFLQLFKKVFEHHALICPQVRKKESVTIDNISHFSNWIATLYADVEHALRHFTSKSIPPKPLSERKSTPGKSPLQKMIEDKDPTITEDLLAQDFWNIFYKTSKSHLNTYHHLVVLYGDWKYQQNQKDSFEEDYYRRPPVGDAFYKRVKAGTVVPSEVFQKMTNPQKETPPFSDPFKAVPHETSEITHPTQSFPKTTTPEEIPNREPLAAPREKSSFRNKQLRNENPKSAPHGKNHSSLKSEEKTPSEVLAKALEEVNEAAQKLQENGGQGIMLSPQNSYVRRLQHTLASDLGLKTESYGFGKQRCVILSKPT